MQDIEHARAITLLLEEGDRVDLVPRGHRSGRTVERLSIGQADWLVSIDMCAEGFDASRIRVVAYLTTVVTAAGLCKASPVLCAIRRTGQPGIHSARTLLCVRASGIADAVRAQLVTVRAVSHCRSGSG